MHEPNVHEQDPNVHEPDEHAPDPDLRDPPNPPALPGGGMRPPKPWQNPAAPTHRHLRLATTGVKTTPGEKGDDSRDIQVLQANQRIDEAALNTRDALDDARTALSLARDSSSDFIRRQRLAIAFAELKRARDDLGLREPNPALKLDRDEALRQADADLSSYTSAGTHQDRQGALDRACDNLTRAELYACATARPDSPQEMLHYLDLKLTEAEVKAAPDNDHLSKWQNREAVQKLYVGPEWFFRRPPGQAPYSNQEFAQIRQQVGELSRRHPEWLIIPGTAYHGDLYGSSYWVSNDALVAFNGGVHVVGKRWEADNLEPNHLWRPQNLTNARFEIGGYKFALEICRDHQKGVALTQSDELVDIHVITSNNVDVNSASVVARDGGLVVWVDGNKGTTSYFRVARPKDPRSPEYLAFKRRLLEARERSEQLTTVKVKLIAEQDAAREQRNDLRVTQNRTPAQEAAYTRLVAKYKELESGIIKIEEEIGKCQAVQKDAKDFIKLTRIGGGEMEVVPDNVCMLEDDRWAH